MSVERMKKIKQKILLPHYLRDLGVLLGRVVRPEEIGRVEEAELKRQKALKIPAIPMVSWEISLADKTSERFKCFVDKLSEVNPSPVDIWTSHTIHCGILSIPSLKEIRWDFSFSSIEDGILTFVTSDPRDNLFLNFCIDDSNEERLEIEIKGKNWTDVVY